MMNFIYFQDWDKIWELRSVQFRKQRWKNNLVLLNYQKIKNFICLFSIFNLTGFNSDASSIDETQKIALTEQYEAESTTEVPNTLSSSNNSSKIPVSQTQKILIW